MTTNNGARTKFILSDILKMVIITAMLWVITYTVINTDVMEYNSSYALFSVVHGWSAVYVLFGAYAMLALVINQLFERPLPEKQLWFLSFAFGTATILHSELRDIWTSGMILPFSGGALMALAVVWTWWWYRFNRS